MGKFFATAMLIGIVSFSGSLRADDKSKVKRVSIQIVDATMGPSRVDGSKWNGFGKVQPQVTAKIASALLGSSPYTAAFSVMAGLAMTNMDKPVPFGVVEVAEGGEFQPELKKQFGNKREHTFTPIISGIEYKNVSLDEGTRLKITLYDYHSITKKIDPMGVAEINAEDIRNALKAQKVYQVQVSDQTQKQVLFIGIEARSLND